MQSLALNPAMRTIVTSENAARDDAKQSKHQELALARHLFVEQQYDECIAVLMKLQLEFPQEEEVHRLLQTARTNQASLTLL